MLEETGQLLTQKHGWDESVHRIYIEKTVDRFANPNLKDAVVRVGRCPIRKLSPSDRLVQPALQAAELGIATPHLVSVMAAAMKFDYAEDDQAVELQTMLQEHGVNHVIASLMGISPDHSLHSQIASAYRKMEKPKKREQI